MFAGPPFGVSASRSDVKVPAPADIAVRLCIAEGELCVRTTYEFLGDGRPVQLSTSWEPYEPPGRSCAEPDDRTLDARSIPRTSS